MTPARSTQLGLVQFVRVAPGFGVTGRCAVEDAASARAALPCRRPGEYVTSALSHAIGTPRPLAATKCLGCGVRGPEAGYERCGVCQKAKRALQAVGVRTGAEPPHNRSGSRRVREAGHCNVCTTAPRTAGYAVCKGCLADRRRADNATRAPDRASRRQGAVRGVSTRGTGRSSSRKRGGAA